VVIKLPLDKIIVQGTVYKTPKRYCLLVKKIGTNSTGAGRLKIDKKPVGDVKELVAPLHVTETNKLGPMDLGPLYYSVPPETELEWDGDAGSKCRLIGYVLIMEAGEAIPAEVLARVKEQFYHYFTFLEGTLSLATDEKWSACDEKVILSYTPKTIEKVVCKGVVMAKIVNVTVAEGDFFLRFYKDNIPLEFLTLDPGYMGVDSKSCPSPPADATEEVPFSLEEIPIEVLGDVTYEVRGHATKELTPTAGTAISVTTTLHKVEYYKKPTE